MRHVLVVVALILGFGCATTESVDGENRPPVANAGDDTTALAGDVVGLDGSESFDPENDPLIYRWELETPQGSSSALTSSTAATTTFQPDLPGTYTATLIVSDGQTDSPPDQVVVTVTGQGGNRVPTAAIAGAPNLAAAVGVELILDGSPSSDPEGTELTFDWSLDGGPDGSAADLLSAGGPEARLTPDIEGSYEISLVVSDGELRSDPVTVFVNATGGVQVPTASAGANQTIDVGTLCQLDGSGSSGAGLTYSWSITNAPAGSTASLDDATIVDPSFTPDEAGTYEIRLVVSSEGVSSAPDTVTVIANEVMSGNETPVADAGPDDGAQTNDIVTVNGAGSSDPDNDTLSYSWTFTSIPSGSQTFLNDENTMAASFIADRIGDYTLELTVSDGTASDTDMVTIAVTGGHPQVEGDILLTEFMNDVVTESTEEWFELHNPTDIEWDLSGCHIEDLGQDDHAIASSLVVEPGGYVTLAKSSSVGFVPDYVYAGFLLSNTADEIIVTCGSNEVAQVAYDSGFPGSETVSNQLKTGSYDETANDSAGNWCTGTATFSAGTGTPGSGSDCN